MYDDLFNELEKKNRNDDTNEKHENNIPDEENTIYSSSDNMETPAQFSTTDENNTKDAENVIQNESINGAGSSDLYQTDGTVHPVYGINEEELQVKENNNNTENIESGSYHHSYVNNEYNPNKNLYNDNETNQNIFSTNNYQSNPYQNSMNTSVPNQNMTNPYYVDNTNPYANGNNNKPKKEKKGLGKGAVAAILVICILLSGVCGFAGTAIYNAVNSASPSSGVVVHKINADPQSVTDKLVDKSTAQITEEVADTVVEVTTEVMTTDSFYGQYVSEGAGSGVVISEDGYIITNNHVIENASKIEVTFRDGSNYEAKLIGTDAEEDVALIKVEATNLKAAVFGDSDTLEVGDKAVAIGNPLGTLGGTVTDGIISALDRKVDIDGETMTLMQTDTAINPGNSGGGLFNGQGELIGMVCAKSAGAEIEGLGFAIPINKVLNIISDLKQYGYVTGRPSVGCQLIDITNSMYARYYFNTDDTGVFIYSVYQGTAAAEAGLQPGDRIIKVNGTKVESASDVENIVDDMKAGDEITFTIDRNSSETDITFALDEAKPSASQKKESNVKNNDNDNGFGWNPFG